jgi:hypothetical protein
VAEPANPVLKHQTFEAPLPSNGLFFRGYRPNLTSKPTPVAPNADKRT